MIAEEALLKYIVRNESIRAYCDNALREFSTSQNKLTVHKEDKRFFKYLTRLNYENAYQRIDRSMLNTDEKSYFRNALKRRYLNFMRNHGFDGKNL